MEAEEAGWFMRPGGLARGSKMLQVRSRGSSLVDSCGWLTNPDLIACSLVVVATSSPFVCVSTSVHGSPPVGALPLCLSLSPCAHLEWRTDVLAISLTGSCWIVLLAAIQRGCQIPNCVEGKSVSESGRFVEGRL